MAPQLFLAQRKARMGGGGSSGVHAMDGQSGDGAREGETLVMHTATKAKTTPQSLGGAYQATRLPKHPA